MERTSRNRRNLNIAIVGNSVAMRVRPPENHPENKNYTVLLRENLSGNDNHPIEAKVTNCSMGGATLRQLHCSINDIIRLFPEYYVLNLGVVDASTREIPRWFFEIISSTSQSGLHKAVRFFYGGLIAKIRRPLVFIRGKRSWVNQREFKKLYTLLIDVLLKETNAEIIGLSINLANERVERALPGSHSRHEKYNEIIKKCLDRSNCSFLDLTDLNPDKHYPDGVHYSAEGHKIVADRIEQLVFTDNPGQFKKGPKNIVK